MSRSGILLPRVHAGDLSIELFQTAMDAAVAYATQHELQVSVALVDGGGHLQAFARVPGTPWHSIELAIDKARTSASFGLPSSTLGDMIDNANERIRMNLLMRQDIVAMGGAFPILAGERLVGAIGVSGASEEEDIDCARAGCEAIVARLESARCESREEPEKNDE